MCKGKPNQIYSKGNRNFKVSLSDKMPKIHAQMYVEMHRQIAAAAGAYIFKHILEHINKLNGPRGFFQHIRKSESKRQGKAKICSNISEIVNLVCLLFWVDYKFMKKLKTAKMMQPNAIFTTHTQPQHKHSYLGVYIL